MFVKPKTQRPNRDQADARARARGFNGPSDFNVRKLTPPTTSWWLNKSREEMRRAVQAEYPRMVGAIR